MMSMLTIPHLFPWKKPLTMDHAEAIKWSNNNGRYEIHTTILNNLDLSILLRHCLEVRNKIRAAVTVNAHLGPSLFRVFPQTISAVLRSIWDLIIPGIDETANGFSQAVLLFIASHGTPEDRQGLVQQLCSPRKLRNIPVQAFYYRLRELNGYITWLPGNAASLNEEQIKQACYDAMPSA
jgi:hypothetical protein